MLKFLLFAGVLAAAYFVFFKKKSLPKPPQQDHPTDEAMIPCATCGTYVDIKETFMRDGKYYCSRECMEV